MKGPATTEKPATEQEAVAVEEQPDPKKQIVTSAEEIEGFFAVKSVLRDVVDVRRVQMRDTKSYCGILLDDNNRQPIARLYLDREQKYLGIFDTERNEQRVPIEGVDDIYKHADAIIVRVRLYEGRK